VTVVDGVGEVAATTPTQGKARDPTSLPGYGLYRIG
jgi:hypothetical protein